MTKSICAPFASNLKSFWKPGIQYERLFSHTLLRMLIKILAFNHFGDGEQSTAGCFLRQHEQEELTHLTFVASLTSAEGEQRGKQFPEDTVLISDF
jgi:hypothetical protein